MNLKKIKILFFTLSILFFITNIFCFSALAIDVENPYTRPSASDLVPVITVPGQTETGISTINQNTQPTENIDTLRAKSTGQKADMPNLVMPDIQIDINGLKNKFTKPTVENGTLSINWIGEYISAIYKYSIGIVGILAAVILMVGGIIWLTAGGNASMVTEAKAWITASLTGLILALCSYTILYQVNPNLLKFKPIGLKQIKKIEANKEINYTAKRSGLDICKLTNGEEGIQLELGDPRVVVKNALPDWLSNSMNIYFDFIKEHSNGPEKDVCNAYCKAFDTNCGIFTSCIKDLGKFKSSNSICCVCAKPSRLNVNFLGEKIKAGYSFDTTGQLPDASVELLNLLSCILDNGLTNKNINRISSISDSDYIGKLTTCDNTGCPSDCQHTCRSCHYGGGSNTNKSLAVDFGAGGCDSNTALNANKQIIAIAQSCGAKYILVEKNHIHVSAPACKNDGNGVNYTKDCK